MTAKGRRASCLAAAAHADVFSPDNGVTPERDVPGSLAKEDGEQDVAVVVHAEQHPDLILALVSQWQ